MQVKRLRVQSKQQRPTARERFLMENVRYAYELETKREHSIIEQTGRMLVYQSLFTAALYAALPSVLDFFERNWRATMIVWLFSVVVTVLTVLGLGVTLAAQGRYEYRTLPDVDETKQFVGKLAGSISYEQIVCTYNEKYITDMYKSLEKNNDKRCYLLKRAMILFYVTLSITLITIIVLLAL